MWLFLIFLLIPMLEIALFIEIGGWLGVWPTLAITIGTAVLGVLLVKLQGIQVLDDLRRSLEQAEDPAEPLAHGAMLLLAGVLLMLPGFFTDTLGLLLMIPPLRLVLFRGLTRNVRVERFVMHGTMRATPRGPQHEPHRPNIIIDGDFEEIEPPQRPSGGGSGWTRH